MKKNGQGILHILLLPLIISMGLLFLIKSIIIKFLTTAYYAIFHPCDTFFIMAKNWKEQILVNDFCYSPELLPDIHKVNPKYQLSGFLKSDVPLVFKIIIPIIWSFAYLYRLSIKSTAWFYFPLAFIANYEALDDDNKEQKSLVRQKWKIAIYFELFIVIALLMYYGELNIVGDIPYINETAIQDLFPQLIKFFGQHINTSSIHLIALASILYVATYLKISDKDNLEKNKILTNKKENKIIYWFIRLRYMLWMIFLMWNAVLLANKHILSQFIS